VTHGQCDARPTVTSPDEGHHRPLTGTKLCYLVTKAHICEQLAKLGGGTAEIRTCDLLSRNSNALTIRHQASNY